MDNLHFPGLKLQSKVSIIEPCDLTASEMGEGSLKGLE